jgi:hypothetical protein
MYKMKSSFLKSCVAFIAVIGMSSCKKEAGSDSAVKGTSVGIQLVSPYSWASASIALSHTFKLDFVALNPGYETDLLLWCTRGNCGKRELRLVIWKKGAFVGDDMNPAPVAAVPVEVKSLVPVKMNSSGGYEIEGQNRGDYYYGLLLNGKLISVGGQDGFDDLCRNSVHAQRIFATVLDSETGTFKSNEIYHKAVCDFPELINGKPGAKGVVFK